MRLVERQNVIVEPIEVREGRTNIVSAEIQRYILVILEVQPVFLAQVVIPTQIPLIGFVVLHIGRNTASEYVHVARNSGCGTGERNRRGSRGAVGAQQTTGCFEIR